MATVKQFLGLIGKQPEAIAATLQEREISDLSVGFSADEIYTGIEVKYDFDYATGDHRRTIRVLAPEQERKFGRKILEWDAGWLKSAQTASEVGRRLLRFLGRPRAQISFSISGRFSRIPPSSLLRITHSKLPGGPHTVVVQNSVPSTRTYSTGIFAELPVGAEVLNLVTLANEGFLPDVTAQGLPLKRVDDRIIFTVLDEQGQPLAGATVRVLDGISVVTNGAGEAIFPASLFKGLTQVEMTISHPDFEPITIVQQL